MRWVRFSIFVSIVTVVLGWILLSPNNPFYAMTLLNLVAPPDPAAIKVQGPDTAGNPVPVVVSGSGSTGTFQTMVTGSASAGNASNTATLAAAAGKTTFIAGFSATAAGSTAALDVTVTVANTITGNLSYTFVFPVGATVAANNLVVTFNPPVPANAVNTAISVNLPAGGAGNTNASVCAWGFQQ